MERALENLLPYRETTRKASRLIAADLRRRIVRGEIAAGEPLPSEAVLIDSFNVSRETLREALSVLESEMLIVIKRGRGGGAVARRPDVEVTSRYVSLLLQVSGVTLGEVLEARLLMFRPAWTMLAEFPAPDSVEQLQAHCDRESAAIEDPLAFVDEVCAFEHAVVCLTGTKTLATLVGVLRDVYRSLLHLVLVGAGPGSALATKIAAHHRDYVRLLASDGPLSCEEQWRQHVADVSAAVDATVGRGTPIDVVPTWLEDSRRRPNRASSRVVLAIWSRIARGELVPGDRLATLPELEAEFEVSRPTLREALRILETEGLLSLRAGSRAGATIMEPTVDMAAMLAAIVLESEQATLADVWEARISFEPSVMALSATRISSERIDEMRRRQADWSWMSTDTAVWIAEAMAFRFDALRGCRNSALLVIFEIIRWIASGSTKAVTSASGHSSWELRRNRENARTYGALIEALEAGAAQRAADVWDQHLRRTVPYFASQLGNRLIVDLLDF